jgi:hypothetical protein
MRLRTFNTAAFALCAVLMHDARPSMAAEDGGFRAAFFSDLCRQQAAALGLARTSDPDVLLAAFETYFAGAPARSSATPIGADCLAPGILLINLLRLNGLDAELVLASTQPTSEVLQVLVYVVALKRYLDPSLPRSEQSDLDRLARETMRRVHFRRPLAGGNTRDPCFDDCMVVYAPGAGLSSISVKTQTIRGP